MLRFTVSRELSDCAESVGLIKSWLAEGKVETGEDIVDTVGRGKLCNYGTKLEASDA